MDYWTKLTEVATLIFANVDELWVEINGLLLSFLSLDAHYLVYTFPNIKALQILSELICFYLCIIKQILHHKAHNICRALLHLEPLM